MKTPCFPSSPPNDYPNRNWSRLRIIYLPLDSRHAYTHTLAGHRVLFPHTPPQAVPQHRNFDTVPLFPSLAFCSLLSRPHRLSDFLPSSSSSPTTTTPTSVWTIIFFSASQLSNGPPNHDFQLLIPFPFYPVSFPLSYLSYTRSPPYLISRTTSRGHHTLCSSLYLQKKTSLKKKKRQRHRQWRVLFSSAREMTAARRRIPIVVDMCLSRPWKLLRRRKPKPLPLMMSSPRHRSSPTP